MKYFLPFLFVIGSMFRGISGDTLSYYIQSKNLAELDVPYIEVVLCPRPLTTRFFVEIDYGQETRFFSFRDRRLAYRSGEYVEFTSRIAAINYMVSLGYEIFDHQYMFDGGGDISGQRLLMRKKDGSEIRLPNRRSEF